MVCFLSLGRIPYLISMPKNGSWLLTVKKLYVVLFICATVSMELTDRWADNGERIICGIYGRKLKGPLV